VVDYYLDDRFLESPQGVVGVGGNGAAAAPLGALEFAKRLTNRRGRDDSNDPLLSGGGSGSSSLDNSDWDDDGYIPEILVIGATSSIGRLIVRRLVRDRKAVVRVLVSNLYSKTLNVLGTGVTYCQGHLGDLESLEYAVTDVDKIVMCAGAVGGGKEDFGEFGGSVDSGKKKLSSRSRSWEEKKKDEKEGEYEEEEVDDEWLRMTNEVEMRARLAKQVDDVGMSNLVRAYQNVRHADYGTSQAAKRSLFKFHDREGDFYLFSIEDEEDDENGENVGNYNNYDQYDEGVSDDDRYNYDGSFDENFYNPKPDENDDYYSQYNPSPPLKIKSLKPKRTSIPRTQTMWVKNKFSHGVFHGRVPTTTLYFSSSASSSVAASAAIVSDRLQSRSSPTLGIDLSVGFAGFVCRVCADGQEYEAFLRTGEYFNDDDNDVANDDDGGARGRRGGVIGVGEGGIEYVCRFTTGRKPQKGSGNKSMNKFVTVRLPFSKFEAIRVVSSSRKKKGEDKDEKAPPPIPPGKVFDGKDVRHIGFRFRSPDPTTTTTTTDPRFRRRQNSSTYTNFYLAIDYIKVYRSQPEPEFVYLSDARIPPVVKPGMVRHDLRQIQPSPSSSLLSSSGDREDGEDAGEGGKTIFDEREAQRMVDNPKDRSDEETYFKYRGEEILKHSGLSYAIVRIAGLNELPSGEFSTVQLQQSNVDLTPVSRAEVADVCANALSNPNARNVCFYMTKTKPSSLGITIDESQASREQFVNLKETT